jgi:hypothetical protein
MHLLPGHLDDPLFLFGITSLAAIGWWLKVKWWQLRSMNVMKPCVEGCLKCLRPRRMRKF